MKRPSGRFVRMGPRSPKPRCCATSHFCRQRSARICKILQLPSIAIVTSQAAQYSPLGDQQIAGQQNAVRALVYYDHLTAYAVAENQIDKLGSPKLAILPSPQALMNKTWSALMDYVNSWRKLAHYRAGWT